MAARLSGDLGVTASGLLGDEVTVSQHCEDAKND